MRDPRGVEAFVYPPSKTRRDDTHIRVIEEIHVVQEEWWATCVRRNKKRR